jgi:flavodoxin
MNAVIVYNSSQGHTRHVAEAMASELVGRGAEARTLPMQRLTQADVDGADVLFFGTWAHGMLTVGVRPAGMEHWLPGLPDLRGKPTVAFATYMFRPAGLVRELAGGLESKGARIIAAKAFRRGHVEGAGQLVSEAMAAATPRA